MRQILGFINDASRRWGPVPLIVRAEDDRLFQVDIHSPYGTASAVMDHEHETVIPSADSLAIWEEAGKYRPLDREVETDAAPLAGVALPKTFIREIFLENQLSGWAQSKKVPLSFSHDIVLASGPASRISELRSLIIQTQLIVTREYLQRQLGHLPLSAPVPVAQDEQIKHHVLNLDAAYDNASTPPELSDVRVQRYLIDQLAGGGRTHKILNALTRKQPPEEAQKNRSLFLTLVIAYRESLVLPPSSVRVASDPELVAAMEQREVVMGGTVRSQLPRQRGAMMQPPGRPREAAS